MSTTVQESSINVVSVNGETFVNGQKIESIDTSNGVTVVSENGLTTINGVEASSLGVPDASNSSDDVDILGSADAFYDLNYDMILRFYSIQISSSGLDFFSS